MRIEARIGWMGLAALCSSACSAPGPGDAGALRPPWVLMEDPWNGAPEGTETPAVTVSGAPAESDVVFHDAAGAVVAWVHTQPDQSAQSVIPADGMITVAQSIDGGRVLQIATGLAPGMEIAFAGSGASETASIGSIRVVTPGPFPGAAYYQFESGCWSAGSSVAAEAVMLEVRAPECDPSDLAVVGQALDGAARPIAYSFVAGGLALPVSAGFNAPGGTPSGALDVTLGPWRTDFVQASVAMEDVPPGAALQLSAWVVRGPGRFGWTGSYDPDGGNQTLPLLQPPGFGDGMGYQVVVSNEQGGSMLEGRTDTPQSISVDGTTDLLSAPQAGAIDLSDPARPAVTIEGDPSGADALVLDLWWEDSLSTSWLGSTLLAPPLAGATLRQPALPPELGVAPTFTFAGAWLTAVDPPAALGYQNVAGGFYSGSGPMAGDVVQRRAWTQLGW